MKYSPSRLALLGLALGVLLALLIAPQTRLLLKMQVLPDSALNAALAGGNTPQTERFVQSHPNDYPVQLAAPFDYKHQTQVQYARSLIRRFPNNASLRANILRYATTREIHLLRDEDYLLEGQPVAKPPVWEPPATPAQLAAFEADAAAGERLDPDNAYFPFMRSIGLFEAHRDAEGLAAVERASRKTQWREYSKDETEGHWRLLQNLSGGREAVASTAVAASLMLPHYQRLRQAARIITYKAVLQEQSGYPKEGLALRRELARCGYLMTTQSTLLIGNLVGIGISEIARSRPGAAPPLKSDPDAQNDPRLRDQLSQQGLKAYVAYVRRLGREDAAQEALSQFQGEQRIRHLASHDYTMGVKTTDFMRLVFSLVAGWALTANILTMALLGLAAWGLSRLPHFRERRPLPGGTGFRAGMALLLTLAGLLFFADTHPDNIGDVVLPLLFLALITLLALSGFAALHPAFRRPFGRGLLAGLGMLAALSVLAAISAWKFHGATDLYNLVNGGLFFGVDDPNHPKKMLALLAGAVGLFVPFLLALVLSIAARARRVPVSAGLVRGFCTTALPVLCALVFLYGGLLLWTARQERLVNAGLWHTVHDEGPYLAARAGQPWPGPVH